MKKLIVVIIVILFLTTGCTKKLNCTKEKSEKFAIIKETFLVSYKNNKVFDIQIDLQAELKKNYDDYTETIEKNLKSQFEKYENIKGISITSNSYDNIAKVHLYIPLNKVKKKELEKLNLDDLEETYNFLKRIMVEKGYQCN